ncbi:iron chelate uptake ABC transporter family permease subunit [Glaesserella parasuis]|nr:fecCD transport family protein [Glaesserella parasuis str. Nagasaki]EQA96393.1 fecCD transport family protein [Glaesserella parasuis 29755]MDO9932514.1 iron chelate uptake ABC transporter family permease subunit [Glaesserella parasuis]MDP0021604.1 iron chelate uptake ABC transporter family permease subunit [Glaesserella parasuis]MDP0034420.1 iron chelate uptake ABC transporter family permease subunit [Glaesserella parasuis]
MPNWLDISSSAIALVGAGLSLILVLTLAMRKTMSPLLLILAGLVVNLYFGSFSALMMLFYPEEARGLAQWGAGSLAQESWRDPQFLAIQAVICGGLIAILLRPLTILSLNDSNAQSLGVPVNRLRFFGVFISAYMISAVVSCVGMLGFIGLASATIIRQLGVRTLKWQLLGAFNRNINSPISPFSSLHLTADCACLCTRAMACTRIRQRHKRLECIGI